MRYGLISDLHYGYHSGSKVNTDGVNVREQDHYDAGTAAIEALKSEGVDCILDGGDMAEIPAPRKRAILSLISLVRSAGVPYLAVDGNHTSLKSSNDIHIYDILESECDNFRGFRVPTFDRDTRVSFVPHSYDNDEIRHGIEESLHRDSEIMVGHWAADDIPHVGQVAKRDLPDGVKIFLGHYHNYRPSPQHNPTYIGATEKTAWDQWDYPTGVGVYDSDTQRYTRIEIPTRTWVNIEAGPEDYLETLMGTRIRDRIARLTVYATPAEYSLVDQVACKAYARESGPVGFTMRRKNPADTGAQQPVELRKSGGLVDEWHDYVKEADIPKGMSRKRLAELGAEALSA